MPKLTALILAGGKGVRMKSDLPKVLHDICGKPMIMHVLDQCYSLGIKDRDIFVVTGKEMAPFRRTLGAKINFVRQDRPLGTGHALKTAWPKLKGRRGDLLVLPADHPLLSPATLKGALREHRAEKPCCTLLSAMVKNPAGLGRVVRDDDGLVMGIVEDKDASPEVRRVKEVNRLTYFLDIKRMAPLVPDMKKSPVTGEYYLNDVIDMMIGSGLPVRARLLEDNREMATVNTRSQFSHVEKVMRKTICEGLMENGVTIVDPESVYIDKDVQIGRDSIIYPYTFLSGKSKVGRHCRIGPMAEIVDCRLEDNVVVKNSSLEGSVIREKASVGSFSHIRPGCDVGKGVRIGNFVELKKATIGAGTTIKHFCYVGDAAMGRRVNVDAGTVTVNYDRVRKHKTFVADDAFIGGGAVLVAPTRVGKGAYIEAGSVIAQNTRIPAGKYYVGLPTARRTIPGKARGSKKRVLEKKPK